MPIYTRWEKTKPVPTRLTKETSLEEQLPHFIETLEEMTEPAAEQDENHAFRSTFFSRKPNAEGVRNVFSRLAKKIVESLD
jgi:ubiquinol-cytochrome c reductase cytochrome b subunit